MVVKRGTIMTYRLSDDKIPLFAYSLSCCIEYWNFVSCLCLTSFSCKHVENEHKEKHKQKCRKSSCWRRPSFSSSPNCWSGSASQPSCIGGWSNKRNTSSDGQSQPLLKHWVSHPRPLERVLPGRTHMIEPCLEHWGTLLEWILQYTTVPRLMRIPKILWVKFKWFSMPWVWIRRIGWVRCLSTQRCGLGVA